MSGSSNCSVNSPTISPTQKPHCKGSPRWKSTEYFQTSFKSPDLGELHTREPRKRECKWDVKHSLFLWGIGNIKCHRKLKHLSRMPIFQGWGNDSFYIVWLGEIDIDFQNILEHIVKRIIYMSLERVVAVFWTHQGFMKKSMDIIFFFNQAFRLFAILFLKESSLLRYNLLKINYTHLISFDKSVHPWSHHHE